PRTGSGSLPGRALPAGALLRGALLRGALLRGALLRGALGPAVDVACHERALERAARRVHLRPHPVDARIVGRRLRGELGEVAGEAVVALVAALLRSLGEDVRAAGELGELGREVLLPRRL